MLAIFLFLAYIKWEIGKQRDNWAYISIFFYYINRGEGGG